MNYLHHLVFDPLSAWEQFKASLVIVAPITVVMLGYISARSRR